MSNVEGPRYTGVNQTWHVINPAQHQVRVQFGAGMMVSINVNPVVYIQQLNPSFVPAFNQIYVPLNQYTVTVPPFQTERHWVNFYPQPQPQPQLEQSMHYSPAVNEEIEELHIQQALKNSLQTYSEELAVRDQQESFDNAAFRSLDGGEKQLDANETSSDLRQDYDLTALSREENSMLGSNKSDYDQEETYPKMKYPMSRDSDRTQEEQTRALAFENPLYEDNSVSPGFKSDITGSLQGKITLEQDGHDGVNSEYSEDFYMDIDSSRTQGEQFIQNDDYMVPEQVPPSLPDRNDSNRFTSDVSVMTSTENSRHYTDHDKIILPNLKKSKKYNWKKFVNFFTKPGGISFGDRKVLQKKKQIILNLCKSINSMSTEINTLINHIETYENKVEELERRLAAIYNRSDDVTSNKKNIKLAIQRMRNIIINHKKTRQNCIELLSQCNTELSKKYNVLSEWCESNYGQDYNKWPKIVTSVMDDLRMKFIDAVNIYHLLNKDEL